MQLDALTLSAIVAELNTLLSGGKINKITQPAAHTVVFNVYNNRRDFRLVLAADPEAPKLYVSDGEYINPPAPPAFCMHLRKHIINAEILNISMPDGERLVRFELQTNAEFSDEVKTLIFEMMGRYSNIFLVGKNGIISDCLKKIPPDTVEAARNALPNLPYIAPPAPPEVLPDVSGVSRAAAELLSRRAEAHNSTAREELTRLRAEYSPTVYFSGGVPTDFTFTPYETIKGEQRQFSSMQEAMRLYYTQTQAAKIKAGKISRLSGVVTKEKSKAERTRKTLEARLADCENLEQNKIFGELITANIYRIKPRDEFAEVQNYFSEAGETVKIPLDKGLTAPQNAQRYYKKYSKQKKTLAATHEQLAEIAERTEYLDSVKYSIAAAETPAEYEEIESELVEAKLLPAPKQTARKKPAAAKAPAFLTFSHGGFTVYAGKNNVQNEYVTFRLAAENDIWLHVRGAAGSHVVIKVPAGHAATSRTAGVLPDEVLLFAARLAAENSSLRGAPKTAVDYCPRKNVKKSRAGTGRVNYFDYNTVIV